VPLFSLDEVKLELTITVRREAKGGINVHVVELGGTGRRDDVQTVTVTLTPWLSKQEPRKLIAPEKMQTMTTAVRNVSMRRGSGVSV
jgi:hypothetical protein